MNITSSSDIILAGSAVALIWLGVAIYLFRIDRRISKIERELK